MPGNRVDGHSFYWSLVQQAKAQGASFFSDAAQAQNKADALDWVKFKLPTIDSWIVAPRDVAQDIMSQAGMGGGAGGGGGGPTGGQGAPGGSALAAVQVGLAQPTGGGQGFRIGANTVGLIVPVREDEWLGVNTLLPANKLNGKYSPRAVNWDGFRGYGSRCLRSGIAKLTDDIETVVDSGASPLSSEYRGFGLAVLPGSGENENQLLLAFADKDVDIGEAPSANAATSYHICQVGPRWGRPRNLQGLPGPTITLSDQGSQVLRLNAIYDHIAAAAVGLRKQSVVAISARVVGPLAGATPRYPLDLDGGDGAQDDNGVAAFKFNDGSNDLDRLAWEGASTNYDMDLSGAAYGAGKYWVTVWAMSLDGYSEPSYASLTIA